MCAGIIFITSRSEKNVNTEMEKEEKLKNKIMLYQAVYSLRQTALPTL